MESGLKRQAGDGILLIGVDQMMMMIVMRERELEKQTAVSCTL